MGMVLLEVKKVSKSYNSNTVLKDLDMTLHKGESLGLLGGSGTGKSVLLRSLIGLEYIDQGQIFYKDKEISNLSEKELVPIRTQVSYSFQSGALFDSINVCTVAGSSSAMMSKHSVRFIGG